VVDQQTGIVDRREFFAYFCNRCGKAIKRWRDGREYTNEQHTVDCWPNGCAGIDYIECRLCKFAGTRITLHVKNIHGLSVEAYESNYGPTKCQATRDKYVANGKINGDWITRKKEAGEDLTAYKEKMGRAVSTAIMNNPDERKRRSELLGELNKRDDARKRSSVAAKKTSARPEIIKARAERLINSYKPSRPEKAMKNFLSGRGFRRNVLISGDFSTLTKRRQIDFLNEDRKIAIEFDGMHHFKPAWKRMPMDIIHRNDVELDCWLVSNDHALIRVGASQYHKNIEDLHEPCKQILDLLLSNHSIKKGLYLIGNDYQNHNHPSFNSNFKIEHESCSHPVPETFIACSEDGNYCGESSMSCAPPVQQRSISCT
jgi:very-short-patch-repair endonuclease